MYRQQYIKGIEKIEGLYKIDLSMKEVDLPYLELDWWKFELDSNIKSHRKKHIKESFELFSESRYKLESSYEKWLYKYKNLLYEYDVNIIYNDDLEIAKSKLTKLLEDYAKSNTYPYTQYSNKKAETVRMLVVKIENCKSNIESLLLISDNPPLDYKYVSDLYHNLKLSIEIEEDKPEPKKRIKKKFKSQNIKVNTYREDSYLYFQAENLYNILTDFKGDYVSFFGIVVQHKDLYEYFKALIGGNFKKVGKLKKEDYICKLTLTNEGFTFVCVKDDGLINYIDYNFDYYSFKSCWVDLEVKDTDKVDYIYY